MSREWGSDLLEIGCNLNRIAQCGLETVYCALLETVSLFAVPEDLLIHQVGYIFNECSVGQFGSI